ncbi:MAG: YqjK-like family protein [Comamonadaceae bacterium]
MTHPDLLLRQQQLLLRSAQLRVSLAEQTGVFRRPMAIADQLRSGLQWLYRHPGWPLVGLLVVIALRPRRAVVWSARLWWAWRTYRQTRSWVATLPLQRNSP